MKPLNIASLDLSGRNLIEASAGTGKTWTIAALYILMILEKELRPEQILVVTYTKAATSELRERIRRRIADTLDLYCGRRSAGDDPLEQLLQSGRCYDGERARQLLTQALYSFDDAAIFTIHGFCQRALMEHAFESGSLFGSDMISDQSALVRQACDDFWRSRILSQPPDVVEHLTAEGYTPERLAKPLEGHFQNPDLIIIPDGAAVDLQPLYEERDRLYRQICQLWSAERNAILGQIEQARLNQQSYKPTAINAAACNLDLWAAGGNAAASSNNLELFSIRKISSRLTKSSPGAPEHPFFNICSQMIEVQDLLKQGLQNRIIAGRRELKQWLEQQLSRRKAELNQRSFDDLLLDLHAALEAASGPELADKLRQRYRAAMIDEFQDTDPLQWNIFQRMSAVPGYPIFLIGDPKQAIYSFRGADVFAYLNAARTVPPGQTRTLATNFRSDRYLINAVSTLFSAAADPFMNRNIPYHQIFAGRREQDQLLLDGVRDTAPFRLWIYPRDGESRPEPKPAATRAIVPAVAAEIARLLKPGRAVLSLSDETRALRPNDIAVLVKSHKQAEQVQESLQRLSIPSVQLGSGTIFESPEAVDLLRILRAVAEPHREPLVREALATPTIGLDAGRIVQYVAVGGEHPEWEAWLTHFQYMHAAAAAGGVVAVVSRLLGSCGIRERLLTGIGGERRLTNLLHCCEMLHQVEREQGKKLTGLITWLERTISTPNQEDTALLRLETDENAVIISTIHASKGLQYPVVFVPFAWDAPSGTAGRILYHNEQGKLVLDLAGEEAGKLRAAEEQKAEAARLLYVALTRAEFRCYAVWGAITGAADSPMSTLLQGIVPSGSALDEQELLTALRLKAQNESSGIFAEILPVAAHTAPYNAVDSADADVPCTCRTLDIPPRDDWRIASFSGLTSGAGHTFEPHDRDTQFEAPAPALENAAEGVSIFDFPRGAQAGTCLHELFETLDFSRLDSNAATTAARAALAGGGFQDKWLPAVRNMVTEVTGAPIIPHEPGFNLRCLRQGDWQTEMEFYLPLKQLDPASLQALFHGILDTDQYRDYYELLARLSFRQSRGMLQGFIDLVFTWQGRFYILDWKSNHLGMKPGDYSRAAMHESMCRSAYILQYHLYTLAVDRHLKARLPDYDYETHFGGIIYVYLRGVSGEMPVNGIYFDRPSPEFIRRSEMLLD